MDQVINTMFPTLMARQESGLTGQRRRLIWEHLYSTLCCPWIELLNFPRSKMNDGDKQRKSVWENEQEDISGQTNPSEEEEAAAVG